MLFDGHRGFRGTPIPHLAHITPTAELTVPAAPVGTLLHNTQGISVAGGRGVRSFTGVETGSSYCSVRGGSGYQFHGKRLRVGVPSSKRVPRCLLAQINYLQSRRHPASLHYSQHLLAKRVLAVAAANVSAAQLDGLFGAAVDGCVVPGAPDTDCYLLAASGVVLSSTRSGARGAHFADILPGD